MEGHLVCNGVFRCSISLFHALMRAHTQLLQRSKPGNNMKDHPPPPMVQWRQSDEWDGEKWERDKTTIWSHGGRSKREKRGVRERESGGQTRSGSHIWQVTSCDKSSRGGLSVFSCVFACGECGPVQLQRQTGRYVFRPRGAHSPPQGLWLDPNLSYVRILVMLRLKSSIYLNTVTETT